VYPEGVDVPGDGRLQENLAAAACYSECAQRYWFGQAYVNYIIVDKTRDVWHEGVAFDTFMESQSEFINTSEPFQTSRIDILYECESNCGVKDISLPRIKEEYLEDQEEGYVLESFDVTGTQQIGDNIYIASVQLPQPERISTVYAGDDYLAVTLVNEQTGTFLQLYSTSYRRLLSSDVKVYQRRQATDGAYAKVFPFVYEYTNENDALNLMQSPDSKNVFIEATGAIEIPISLSESVEDAQVTYYSPVRIEITANHAGALVIPESYYPGWKATVNGENTPVYRANINFRAVLLTEGENTVIFEYNPKWYPEIFIFGGLAWLVSWIFLAVKWREKYDRKRTEITLR
jgi:hypothetical protein